MRKKIALRTALLFPSNARLFPFERRGFFLRRKINFLRQENFSSSEGKKGALRKEKRLLPKGEKLPCGRKKISVYKKIYFRIYEKIFSHMRKFIFVRTEIFRLAERTFLPPKDEGLPPERRAIGTPKEGRSEALRERKTPISRYFTRGLDALPLRP